ncbi:uncharacterized protein J8A68_002023 [[Candida] subhashii]|uniref:DUF2423 domain-containing protein n=1 Tax=[Candida] subhashii TaxID=561895 RepID=A0A8J5QJY3_9ASCO|nr:uncharacterized protein J8A68_002023 [[Candida] subhashii]KAG7664467.1 hypothetical protein J8A68_002023 [[Candida] subhashii]
MAKSLRSKSKLRAKSVKRKGEFSKFVDDRNKRIADKLAKETVKQDEAKKEETVDDKPEEDMEVDKSEQKVSTSGWRDSRKQIYKQRTLKKKKGKTLKF